MFYREKEYCAYCGSRLTGMIDSSGHRFSVCERCNAHFYENPVPATALVIPNETNSEIVLVKRAVEPCKGHYSLPGGFMEIGETPDECAVREMHEETNLVGKVDRLLGVATQFSPQYKSVLLVGYVMSIVDGKVSPSDDAGEAEFFPLESLPPVAFSGHRYFIEKFAEILGIKVNVKGECL